MTARHKILLISILLLAVFFRLHWISVMPGGLFPDEAANGLDINLMQQGQLQPFYERGNGREALFFYMLWGSVELFGKTPFAHHLISAIIGTLAVAACFFVTRRLFLVGADKEELFDSKNSPAQRRAVNIALLAAFLMAVNSWHVVLSRTAFRANLIPLFSALTLYLLLCAYQAQKFKSRLILSFLTGASFALGFYTYIAYRILIPILLAIILWPLLAKIKEREFWRTVIGYKLLAVSFIAGFVLFIYPLAKYFYQHPGSFVGRSGQVSVFNANLYSELGIKEKYDNPPPPRAAAYAAWIVAKKSVAAYFKNGDLNWRHNISGQPFLSPLVSPFFGIGLILASLFSVVYFFSPAARAGLWRYFLLALWFWGMLLPVVTTAEGIPHGLRSAGTIPAVFIIAAWAIYEFALIAVKLHNKLHQHWERGKKLAGAALKIAAAVFFAALISQTYILYFVYAANSSENFYFFRSDLTAVSDYLKKRCDRDRTYLILDKFSVQTTDYLTSDWHGNFSDKCSVPYRQVDPEDSWKLPVLKSGEEAVFTQSSVFDSKKFKKYHPEAELSLEIKNKFEEIIMRVYKAAN